MPRLDIVGRRGSNSLPPVVALAFVLSVWACESVIVRVVDVEQVAVQPTSTTVVAGETVRLEAVVEGPAGAPIRDRAVSWSSSDETVASVSVDGVVTGYDEGTVVISARAEGVTGAASVEVLPRPAIGLDQAEVVFAAPYGGADPPSQVVEVANAGAGELTDLTVEVEYTAGRTTGWLSASLADIRAPTTLTLQVITGSLEEETHTATVVLGSDGGGDARLPVSFTVGDPEPRIGLDRTEVEFEATLGGGAPVPQDVAVTNTGGQSLTGLGASIDYRTGGSGWLTSSLSPSSAPATLRLVPDPAGLATGTHVAVVSVLSAVAVNSPREVTVRLVVSEPPPVIELSRGSVSFTATAGGASPDPVEVEITNEGGGTLSGLATSIEWEGDETGWLTVLLSDTRAPATLELAPSTAALEPGSYGARVEVSAPAAGENGVVEVTVSVREPENQPPEADFTFECTFLACTFEDGSSDADGTVEAWEWDFGDGSESSEPNPEHVYAEPGTYSVVLEVTDDDGATDTATREVSVSVPENEVPKAAFAVSCVLWTCTFTDQSEDPDGTIVAWRWDFGDGSSSTERNPQHFYFPPGTYTVTLEVEDDAGATATATREVSL